MAESSQAKSLAGIASFSLCVSYASENAEAARRIADVLLTLGFGDAWLDKKKLIGGDDWSDRIEEAIEKSDFFPVLSAEADARRKGVFWEEWQKLRKERLLPVYVRLSHESASASASEQIARRLDEDVRRNQDAANDFILLVYLSRFYRHSRQ